MTAARAFSGVERAAVLMMLVGDEEAAAILQKLDPDEVRALGSAMYAVADVSEAEMHAAMDEFVARAETRSGVTFDPAPRVETILTRALGPERAATMLARILPPEARGRIEALQWYDPAEIAAIIADEHPQIGAVLLAQLDPERAGSVFEQLPEALQPQILRRVARLGPVSPEAIATIEAMLRRRGATARRAPEVQIGGTREAARILSSARRLTEQRVMPRLAKIDRDVARAIEEAMFVFDHLLALDDKNLSTLIRQVDGEVLIKALKGSDATTRERFLGCMSSRAADGIRDEMEARGPMKLAEALDAQKAIVAVARGLVKDGTIRMPGKGGEDEYV